MPVHYAGQIRARISTIWDPIRTSFWFVPAGMTIAGAILAVGTLSLDRFFPQFSENGLLWRSGGAADGARTVLATIAGSMITVAGVTFSITVVALTLASSQFGPRLLRNFMANKTTQAALGMFIATFVYCMIVLRSIRDVDDTTFIPQISIDLSLILAVLSLGVLIYFIHSTASMIRAESVIVAVSDECGQAINSVCPNAYAADTLEFEPDAALESRLEAEGQPIAARASGYIQTIELDGVVEIAQLHHAVIRLLSRPGHFIVEGDAVAIVYPPVEDAKALSQKLRTCMVLGMLRTPVHDVEFGFEQLVEVAVRALSPGINDPFTAIACIDRIGVLLTRLCRRNLPEPYRYDSDGHLRVIVDALTFGSVADAGLNQIRQNGKRHVAVCIRMLEMLAVVARQAQRTNDTGVLRRHAELIWEAAQSASYQSADLEDVEKRYTAAMRELN